MLLTPPGVADAGPAANNPCDLCLGRNLASDNETKEYGGLLRNALPSSGLAGFAGKAQEDLRRASEMVPVSAPWGTLVITRLVVLKPLAVLGLVVRLGANGELYALNPVDTPHSFDPLPALWAAQGLFSIHF